MLTFSYIHRQAYTPQHNEKDMLEVEPLNGRSTLQFTHHNEKVNIKDTYI